MNTSEYHKYLLNKKRLATKELEERLVNEQIASNRKKLIKEIHDILEFDKPEKRT